MNEFPSVSTSTPVIAPLGTHGGGSVHSSQVKQKALELGFHKAGIATVHMVDKAEVKRLQAWLIAGYQANMDWMANPKRQDINLVMPEVRSLICVALNYYTPHPRTWRPLRSQPSIGPDWRGQCGRPRPSTW